MRNWQGWPGASNMKSMHSVALVALVSGLIVTSGCLRTRLDSTSHTIITSHTTHTKYKHKLVDVQTVQSESGVRSNIEAHAYEITDAADPIQSALLKFTSFLEPNSGHVWVGFTQHAYVVTDQGIVGVTLSHIGIQLTKSLLFGGHVALSPMSVRGFVPKNVRYEDALRASRFGFSGEPIETVIPVHQHVREESLYDLRAYAFSPEKIPVLSEVSCAKGLLTVVVANWNKTHQAKFIVDMLEISLKEVFEDGLKTFPK